MRVVIVTRLISDEEGDSSDDEESDIPLPEPVTHWYPYTLPYQQDR